jgi:hypothetical protein
MFAEVTLTTVRPEHLMRNLGGAVSIAVVNPCYKTMRAS